MDRAAFPFQIGWNLFGRVKNGGYGREVSEFGIREFCSIKTVLIEEL